MGIIELLLIGRKCIWVKKNVVSRFDRVFVDDGWNFKFFDLKLWVFLVINIIKEN